MAHVSLERLENHMDKIMSNEGNLSFYMGLSPQGLVRDYNSYPPPNVPSQT